MEIVKVPCPSKVEEVTLAPARGRFRLIEEPCRLNFGHRELDVARLFGDERPSGSSNVSRHLLIVCRLPLAHCIALLIDESGGSKCSYLSQSEEVICRWVSL